jgi:hypothetical protein
MTIPETAHPPAGITHALATLRLLYPEPWAVGGSAALEEGPTSRRDVILLPTASQPRLILPAHPRQVLAGVIDHQLVAGRRRTRAARRLLRTLAAAGIMGASWPARVAVGGAVEADSIERWLERTLGLRDCRVSISLGRPRANRKPVLQVVDAGGAVQAYVKVGVNELTTALLDNEAAALRLVRDAQLPGLRVPGVLAYDEWRGLTLLALEAVPTRSSPPSRPTLGDVGRWRADAGTVHPVLVDAARQIAGIDRVSSVRWADCGFRPRLLAAIESAGPRVAGLLVVVERLDAADPLLDLGGWHGDFNPGNFAIDNDHLVVWDWERFDRGVPVGFDLLHHRLHDAITRRGADPRRAAASLVDGADLLLAELGVAPAAARVTAEVYLAWLACRYVGDGQDRAGSRLGRVEDWLLAALEVPAR